MTKVRAAVLTAPGQIRIQEFPFPDVGPRDALLRVEMCGICGSDPKTYHGMIKLTEPPLILGHEFIGHIAEIGPEAEKIHGVKKGDRVFVEPYSRCGNCEYCLTGLYRMCENGFVFGTSLSSSVPPHLWGGYSEYVYIPPGCLVHKITEEMRPEAAVLIAAVLSNGITWTRTRGGTSIGDAVVIQGAGAQGLSATIAAKECGASPIIVTGTSIDRVRLKLAREFGADFTINVDEENLIEKVREITGGKMANVVVEVTGSPKAVALSPDLVRKRGTIVLASVVGTSTAVPILTDKLALKEIRFQGAFSSEYEAFTAAKKLVESGKYPVEKMVTHRFSLNEAEKAVRTAGGEIPGEYPIKVVLVP